MKKFVDDTKCYMVVETEEDRHRFQSTLTNLENWSSDWQMLFNMDKCHVIHAGKQEIGQSSPQYKYHKMCSGDN